MTVRRSRSKFPWSDEQVRNALAPRAFPYCDDEELEIIHDLAAVGASHILARREGGRMRRMSTAGGEIRRMLVSWIFDGSFSAFPARLRKTPTSPPTAKKCQILEERGWKVSEATVLKDIKKLGSRQLRG